MLSTITWTNRGVPGNDSDGFEAVFTTNVAAARDVVAWAFTSWERVITNFNNGSNNIDIAVNVLGAGETAASASVTTIVDGRPTAGSITVVGGINGLGSGYFVDPTPWEHSEYTAGAHNAFSGFAAAGTAAANNADLYTLIMHEFGHVLGFAKHPSLKLWTSGFLSQTNIVIPAGRQEAGAGAGGLNNTYWLFDGPSVDALLNGSGNTGNSADLYNAVHTSSVTDPPVDYNGNTYYGSADGMNAFFSYGQRSIPSLLDALILKDAYGYTIANPTEFGTFYAMLQNDGQLRIRGGAPAGLGFPSNDSINIVQSGSNIIVEIDLGNTVPGTAMTGTMKSTFLAGDVTSIVIDAGDGNDFIRINPLQSNIPISINGGSGSDTLEIVGSSGNDTFTVGNSTLTSTGINITSRSSIESVVLSPGQGVDHVYGTGVFAPFSVDLHTGGSTLNLHTLNVFSEVTINGGAGSDVINIAPNGGANAIQSAVVFNGAGGGDTLNLGNGTLASFVAPITFNGGGGFEDKVVLNDQATNIATTYNVYPTTVTRSPTFGGLTYSDIDRIVLNLGSGDDTVYVANGVAASVEAYGNNGNDNFIVGGGNLAATTAVFDGGNGNDQITFDDHLNSIGRIWDVRPHEVLFGGLLALATTGFESVSILAGTGNDEFTFKGVLGSSYHIEAGPGTNSFTLGYQDAVFFSSPVTLLGGDGSDIFTINDAAVSVFTSPLVMDGGNGFNYMNVNEPLATGFVIGDGYFIPKVGGSTQGTFGFSNINTTVFTGNAGNNDFTIYSAGTAFGTFTINGGAGNDSFLLAPQPSGYTFRNLTINGQSGIDTFTLDASALTTDESYTIGSNILQIARGLVTETITTSSMDQITLTAGSGNDTFAVNQYSAGTPVQINGGPGDDTLNFGGGSLAANITDIAQFIFNGDSGFDRFNIHNNVDIGNWTYSRVSGSIHAVRSGYGGVTLIANTTEEMTVNAGPGADTFLVPSTASGTHTIFNGAGGVDTLQPGSIALGTGLTTLSLLHGKITFDAGTASALHGGNVIISASGHSTPKTAHLTATTLGAHPDDNLFGLGWLEFFNITDMLFTLGTGADTVYAQPLALATVRILGNDPTAPPGDTLNINLSMAENYVVNGTSFNGNITSTNLKTISYTGFETGPNIITPPALPGDYNLDGTVDAADYVVWRKTLGEAVAIYSGADGDGNGIVEHDDHGVWRMHFGQTLPPPGFGAGAALAEVQPQEISLSESAWQLLSSESLADDQEPMYQPRASLLERSVAMDSQLLAESRRAVGAQQPSGRELRVEGGKLYHEMALMAWLSQAWRHRPGDREPVDSVVDDNADASESVFDSFDSKLAKLQDLPGRSELFPRRGVGLAALR